MGTTKQYKGGYGAAATPGPGGGVTSVTASSPLASTGGTTPNITATKIITAGLSSGIIEGGQLSINADNTKFDIADGNGVIIDNTTNPNTPIVYEVTWSGLTAQTVTNLGTSTVSFIFINNAGGVVQTTEPPTEENTRDYIYIGQLGHANLSTIQTAVPQPNLFASPVHLFRDIFQTLGYVNIGNVITANGANLSIDKSIGSLVGEGAGFYDNAKAPSRKDLPVQVLATIRRRTQTGGSGTSTTIDVSNYDLNGTVTAISGTKAQNQRVYLLTSGNIVIQYGQQLYNSVSEAIQGLSGESFVELENVKQGQLIAIITVQSNCTSLQDTTRSRIANLGRFGTLASATSGVSVTSLQQAYNNSLQPEITTDATRGALTVKRGSAADNDDVLEVLNGAGTKTFSVDGNGNITANNFSGSPTFTTVTPAAGFSAPPAAYETVSYSKNGNVLYVSGVLTRSGTGLTLADTLLFTLPVGFRPAKENQFEISFGAADPATDNGDCICRVKANGQVTATGPNFMNTNDIIRVNGVVKLA